MQLSPDLEALLRMGLAVLCGLAVGVNRAHHGSTPHPNRLRVHVLVGLSACLMVLAAGPDPAARSRVIQGVATGVGFLGAGEILVPSRPRKNGPPEVMGLSSAASIWFTASLGVTVAAASPLFAMVALVLALVTLSDRRNGVDQPPSPGGDPSSAAGSGPGQRQGSQIRLPSSYRMRHSPALEASESCPGEQAEEPEPGHDDQPRQKRKR
ncbi:MAG: MgtC/SapB family protein [Synechococcaceae cyanobacterium ELA739]|jgi:putative Mg2+ transporter-C (MgtC) family protein